MVTAMEGARLPGERRRATIAKAQAEGIDVPAANGDDSYELPLPATYVIDTTGRICAAFIDRDYTKRMEPADMIAALQKIAN